jgi:hypothetical protein
MRDHGKRHLQLPAAIAVRRLDAKIIMKVPSVAQIMMANLVTPLRTFLFFSALLSVVCHAECRRAHNDEVPHGANELIELREQTVKRVSGTILVGFGGSEPAGNVVVELYRREGNLDVQKTVQQSRVIACVTGSDGRFSFFRPQVGQVFAARGNGRTSRDK